MQDIQIQRGRDIGRKKFRACGLAQLLFSAAAFTLSLQIAEAEKVRYEGVSALAAHSQRFPCKRVIKSLQLVPAPAVQTLYGTFGRSFRCLRRFAHKFRDRPHLIAVNVLNGPNRRRNALKQGELLPNLNTQQFLSAVLRRKRAVFLYEKRLERIAVRLRSLANENTVFRIYPELEDNLTNRAFNVLAEIGSDEFAIWRSGLRSTGGGWSGIELHGFDDRVLGKLAQNRGSCSWSNDGVGILTDRNFPGLDYVSVQTLRSTVAGLRANNCDVFLWNFAWQGIRSSRFVEPLRRTHEFSRSDVILVRGILKKGK